MGMKGRLAAMIVAAVEVAYQGICAAIAPWNSVSHRRQGLAEE